MSPDLDWYQAGAPDPWPRWVRPSLATTVVTIFLLRTLGSLDVAVVGHLRGFLDELAARASGIGAIENPEILHTGMRLGGLKLYFLLHQPARLVPDPVVGLALLYGLLQLAGLGTLMLAARRRVLREELVWVAAMIVAGTLGGKGILLENSALMNALGTVGFGSTLLAIGAGGLGWWLLAGISLAAGAQLHIAGLAGLGAAVLAAALVPGARRGLAALLVAAGTIALPGVLGLAPMAGSRAGPPPLGMEVHPLLELLDPMTLREAPLPVAIFSLVALGVWALLLGWWRHRPWTSLRAPQGTAPAAGALVLGWIGAVVLFGFGFLLLSSSMTSQHLSELLSVGEKLAIAAEAPAAVAAAAGLFLLWEWAPCGARRALPPGSRQLLVAAALSLLCWNALRAVVGGPLRWRGTANLQCSLGAVDETYPYLWTNYAPVSHLMRRTSAYRRLGFGTCAFPLDGVQTLDVLPTLLSLWQRPLRAQNQHRCDQVVLLPRTAELEALELPRSFVDDTWIAVLNCRPVPMDFRVDDGAGEVLLDLENIGSAGTLLVTLADRSRVLAETTALETPGIARVATAAWPPVLGEGALHHWYAFSVERRAGARGFLHLPLGRRPRSGTPEATTVQWVRAPIGQQGEVEPLVGGREVASACFVAAP